MFHKLVSRYCLKKNTMYFIIVDNAIWFPNYSSRNHSHVTNLFGCLSMGRERVSYQSLINKYKKFKKVFFSKRIAVNKEYNSRTLSMNWKWAAHDRVAREPHWWQYNTFTRGLVFNKWTSASYRFLCSTYWNFVMYFQ